MYAFVAPPLGPGTGKTLLAEASSIIASGQSGINPWPGDEEAQKTITSKLLCGDSFVIFDNLEGVVKSPDLAALITSTHWSSRVLYKNEAPKLPNTTTWCITLNDAKLNRDIARHSIMIKLDAKMKDPFRRRGFAIRDLKAWCKKHRGKIIHSILTIVTAWANAGRPTDPDLVFGSFESYADVVGGILHYAGLRGLPACLEAAHAVDQETANHHVLVEVWHQMFGEHKEVSAAQLADAADRASIYGEKLGSAGSETVRGQRMARILRELVNHEFGGFTIRRQGLKNGYRKFYIEQKK